MNMPPQQSRTEASVKDKLFLRRAALRTWRYFAEFSNQEHNWLIPDNVQEEPYRVAARVSPTNVGLLLNARQVACELGYLTVSEFAEQTARTLATMRRMKRHRGHLFNWYNTHTLEPLPPLFVSTVDSGNLVASLWTLQQGCEHLLEQPVLRPSLADGFLDDLRVLTDLRSFPRRLFIRLERRSQEGDWIKMLLKFPVAALERIPGKDPEIKHADDVKWFALEAARRLHELQNAIVRFVPWMLPDFAALRKDKALALPGPDVLLKARCETAVGS